MGNLHQNPDHLEAEAYELMARAYAKRAEAARARAEQAMPAGDWIRVDALPVSKRSALAAARTGSLRAIKQGRTWLTTKSDAAAWLANAKRAIAANDGERGDDDVRASLGLAPRRAS